MIYITYIEYICDCATIGKLSITRESHISDLDLSAKMASLWKLFGLHTQKDSPVAHSPCNRLYVVGISWSVDSISGLGEHIYLRALQLGQIYRLWTSPPYYRYYI